MKFFISVFFLSLSVCFYVNGNSVKRNVIFDVNEFIDKLSEECIEENKNSEYAECITLLNLNNYKQICTSFKSEKCQNFYNNPLDYFPICKEIPEFKELYQPLIIKTFKLNMELECQTDENDNLCPIALYMITRKGSDEILEDTCKSKICSESAKNVYKKFDVDQLGAYENLSTTTGNYNYQQLTFYKDVVEALESDECKALRKSDATTLKINKTLLISAILLLLFFI